MWLAHERMELHYRIAKPVSATPVRVWNSGASGPLDRTPERCVQWQSAQEERGPHDWAAVLK
jgi:hypothetical protein